MDYRRLLYRRQFYLTTQPIVIEGIWNHIKLNETYHLYHHVDLNFTSRQIQKNALYILGDLFDPYNPSFTNEDIINQLVSGDFNDLVVKTNLYTGRYVIIFFNEDNLLIFNDPATARKVFYTTNTDQVWCGSQPHILADLLKIPITTNKDKLQYFRSEYFFKNEFIGIYHHTIYDDISQLPPNHYLDTGLKRRIRFWPNERIHTCPVDTIVKSAGDLIRGYMNAIYHRYPKLMIPITAGMDSRFLLAASRDISQHVFYYINKLPAMGEDNIDIKIGKQVVESLGLKYHILKTEQNVDEKFRAIYLKNTIYPFESRLPVIYDIYFKRYPDHINLPGNFSEVGRNAWVFYRSKITGRDLVNLTIIGNFKYAIEKSNEWINDVKGVCDKYHVNMLDLHYWENRIASWGTHFQSNKDIAQEEILPFNSRQLMINLLSSKRKYRDEDICYLHRRIIKYLWGDVLHVPVNPGFRKSYLRFVKNIGIYYFLYMIKHHVKILIRQIFRSK